MVRILVVQDWLVCTLPTIYMDNKVYKRFHARDPDVRVQETDQSRCYSALKGVAGPRECKWVRHGTRYKDRLELI